MTWRQRIAFVHQYADVGQYIMRSLRDALVAGSAVKILFWATMPWWAVFALSPLVYAAWFAAGWAYKRFGWMQEGSAVGVIEGMSWPAYVDLVWKARTLAALGQPINGIPSTMPEDIRAVLTPDRRRCVT